MSSSEKPLKIFIAGAKGMLGHAVVRTMSAAGFEIREWDLGDGDLADEKTARRAVESFRPGVVVNCAGFTDVEACEDPARIGAGEIQAGNVLIPRHLARACRQTGARLVHISTDYVFDGEKTSPYVENDPVNPLSEYGRSKLLGEWAVEEELPKGHCILRTAWLYGAHGRNFVDTILKKASTHKKLEVVNDQTGSPTYAADLAEAITACVRGDCTGLYHAVGAGRTTWYGLAVKALELAGVRGVEVNPCPTSKYPTKARRPKNSVLSCARLEKATGYRFRPWQNALADYLKRLGA